MEAAKFLSTPSARRATVSFEGTDEVAVIFLSTPSARRATEAFAQNCVPALISIHALREEGDLHRSGSGMVRTKFLSTPSARRATVSFEGTDEVAVIFLSTPSARRATEAFAQNCVPALISIHALREEGDLHRSGSGMVRTKFLSTPSARRATTLHLLRERVNRDFYPRPPRGGRPVKP